MDANDPSAFCLSHPMANGRIFLVGMSLLRKQKFFSWQTPVPGLLLPKVSWTTSECWGSPLLILVFLTWRRL